ncbi:hypothetical protein ATERTT37_000701 [Aspergillus terreus]
MNREIPGFYYDPEKKKYFKIEASHKATPGLQYSKDAKRQRKAHRSQRIAKEKIKRSAFLANPLLGINQEIGALNISKSVRQEQRGLLYASQVRRSRLHQFEPWPNDYTIKQVLRNKRSGILIANCDQEKWTYNRTMERVLFKDPYRGNTPLFAVGTSDGLYTLGGFGSQWTLSKKQFASDVFTGKPILHRRVDSSHALVTSVEWLSSDVIAAGLKDSAIFLHDLRSGGTATRLQHSHAVSKIRRVDPYRMVVAGINSLKMYDIRYPPNGLQRNPNPNNKYHTSTRPYLEFLDYSPEIIPDFDLSPELGLLASASDERKIQLFSLRTGEQITSPLSQYQYKHPISSICFEPGDGSSHGPQTPSILVCAKATVDEWIW